MENQRREFLKNITLGGFGAAVAPNDLFTDEKVKEAISKKKIQLISYKDLLSK